MALMAVAHTPNKITIHDGFTGAVTTSFTLSHAPYGLAWDGTNLIVGDPFNDTVWKYSGLSNQVLQSFTTSGHNGANGVAWDGTNVILCPDNGLIYRHVGFSSTVDSTINSPGGWTYGVTWVNGGLISSSAVTNRIYVHDGFSETILTDFVASPDAVSPQGISFDGTNLLHTDSAGVRHKVYQHSGITSTILASFDTVAIGGVPTGIAWITQDVFSTSLQYKNASSTFVVVTSALGEVGSDMGIGAHTCYWDNPSQDRTDVEISDEVMQVTAVPDPENQDVHSVNITSATQMTSGDGTGAQGDVKVEYEIT